MDYTDQDHFIVKIKLKDDKDEIFLAKGLDINNPDYMINQINSYNGNDLESLNENDIFMMPEVHLDYKRDYDELKDLFFRNKGFEEYYIKAMYEKIKFDINNEGARVENEAVIAVDCAAMPSEEAPVERKLIILDKPFWIVMKRTDSQSPYFILGVNNTSIMEKN